MLLELRINNLALIERAELQSGPGLNILTGETGAGKSILITALGLLIGERAAGEQVGNASRNGEGSLNGDGSGNDTENTGDSITAGSPDNGATRNGKAGKGKGSNGKAAPARALVEGFFDLRDAPRARKYLVDADIPIEDDQLVVSREISAEGRSRVRLNGRMATASALRELGALLVDLHGQHETQRLLDPAEHLSFLDAFGEPKHAKLRQATREAWRALRQAQRRLDELSGNEQARAQRLDMLSFQANEIDAVAPEVDEDLRLTDERARLVNAEKLREAAATCRDALLGGDEGGAMGLLNKAIKAAREIQNVDASVEGWLKELEDAVYPLDDAANEARAYADSLDADPLRLEDIEARLHRLTRLKRKYGDTLSSVIAHRAEIEQELSDLSLSDADLTMLREEAEQKRAAFHKAADKLSVSRKALAAKIAPEVVKNLASLAMSKARFDVHFDREEVGNGTGTDRIEFLFSANPGQPLRSLAKIASGGEISRVMLALRAMLAEAGAAASKDGIANGTPVKTADSDATPTLIFDEVDTGIGGVTAEAVGEKMHELARRAQVFCVTHLPQIARRADRHYHVLKESDDLKTTVSIKLLKGDERARELARMMGGETPDTLRHAKALLKSSK